MTVSLSLTATLSRLALNQSQGQIRQLPRTNDYRILARRIDSQLMRIEGDDFDAVGSLIESHLRQNQGIINPDILAAQISDRLGIRDPRRRDALLGLLRNSIGVSDSFIITPASYDFQENRFLTMHTPVTDINQVPRFIQRGTGVTDEQVLKIYNSFLALPQSIRQSFERNYTLRIVARSEDMPRRTSGVRGVYRNAFRQITININASRRVASHVTRHEAGHFVDHMPELQHLRPSTRRDNISNYNRSFTRAWFHQDLQNIFTNRTRINEQERINLTRYLDRPYSREREIFAEVFAALTGPPTPHNQRIVHVLFPATAQWIRTNVYPTLNIQGDTHMFSHPGPEVFQSSR